jgi:DNA-directed RNA polymerase subunit H (RpoH/RPB5)
MATQNSSILISSIYRSRLILLELLKTQDYNTIDYDGFSVNEINTMKNNKQLDMMLEKNEEDETTKQKKKIYIRYYLDKSLRPQNLQEIVDDLFNIEEVLTKNDTLFIIIKDEANETLVNTIKHIWEQYGIFIIIQSLKRLQFNILKHVLVPPHRILNNNELMEVKKKYNIMHEEQFPEISRFDPVAQSIGIRPGEVCEIIRSSKTSIKSKYYRICV